MNNKCVYVDGLDNTLVVSYYEKLLESVYSIIYYLKESKNSMDDIEGTLINYYSVDDSLMSNVNIKSLNEDVADRIYYLENYVIPSIYSKINGLK